MSRILMFLIKFYYPKDFVFALRNSCQNRNPKVNVSSKWLWQELSKQKQTKINLNSVVYSWFFNRKDRVHFNKLTKGFFYIQLIYSRSLCNFLVFGRCWKLHDYKRDYFTHSYQISFIRIQSHISSQKRYTYIFRQFALVSF